MARRRIHAPLNVFLNGRIVGVLRREATGAIDFQYATEWRDWEHTFPVSLSLPLREDRYIGAPVINVFDNLLPDGDVIRRRVAERVGAGGTDAFSLLAALGQGLLPEHPEGVTGARNALKAAGYAVEDRAVDIDESIVQGAADEWAVRKLDYFSRIRMRGVADHMVIA